MAFHISIRRVCEDEHSADYVFQGDGPHTGRFSIDKGSGEIRLLEPLQGDDRENYFQRAAYKILKCWRAGELPAMAVWAS